MIIIIINVNDDQSNDLSLPIHKFVLVSLKLKFTVYFSGFVSVFLNY
jgi:hypothetical protein